MMNSWLGLGIAGTVLIVLVMMIVPLLASIFWIWMLIDCMQRPFKDKTDKVVWILVLIFTHIIGALIYFFVIKRKSR